MKEINRKGLRNFGLILGAILAVIGFRLFFKHQKAGSIFIIIGALFALSALILSSILLPLYKIWVKMARILGWVNTRILFILAFYLIITPIGLFIRLFRKDLLGLRMDKNKASYWIKRPHKVVDYKQYEKQF